MEKKNETIRVIESDTNIIGVLIRREISLHRGMTKGSGSKRAAACKPRQWPQEKLTLLAPQPWTSTL